MPDRYKTWIPRLLVGIAALVALYFLGRSTLYFIYYNWKTDTFPYSVDYGEGPILDQVMRLSKFQNIYKTDIEHLPFTVALTLIAIVLAINALSIGFRVWLRGRKKW